MKNPPQNALKARVTHPIRIRRPRSPSVNQPNQAKSREIKDHISILKSPTPPPESISASKHHTSDYRAKGKIAALPREQRELINQMLVEGSTYPAICEKLLEHGVSLNTQNVSNWHNGAHQDWLLHQEWREDTRTLRDAALELTDGCDPSRFNQAALHLASIQIFAALRHLPRGPLEQKLGGDSGSFARLVNALSRATRETLNAQKYLDACTQARAILQRVVKDPKRKLDQEETRAIVRAVDRVLGLNFEDEPNPTPDEPGSAAD